MKRQARRDAVVENRAGEGRKPGVDLNPGSDGRETKYYSGQGIIRKVVGKAG